MIDKSIPYYPLTMVKEGTGNYPRHDLPSGYRFEFYKKGDEKHWAEIEVAVGQFSDIEKGLEYFNKEFIALQDLDPEKRMLFVISPDGEYVGTASLWNGLFYGEKKQRLHWVAVKDSHSGKGIAKAMLCRLMDLYCELGYSGFIYLLTGTRNWHAVSLYRKFGFSEYISDRSPSSRTTDEEFAENTKRAVAIINEMISKGMEK